MMVQSPVKSSLRLLPGLKRKAENLTDTIFLIMYFKIVIYVMLTRF